MIRSAALAVLIAAAVTTGGPSPLVAQARPHRASIIPGILVIAHSDLRFGTLLPGIRSSVDARESRAALFEIQGPPGASVRLELSLPDALTNSAGQHLPLSFNAGDGLADYTRSVSPGSHLFDPRAPLIRVLGSDGRTFLRLGGSAQPTLPQAGGEYRATILLTVYDLGS